MVTYSKVNAECQQVTPTTIIQKFQLLFKKEQSIDTIVYKNETIQTTHHIHYKILNDKKFILMDYYGQTVSLPDITFIYKDNEGE